MSLAPPKPSPLVPGYRLDRYELLCPIAEGGMASVWVARLQGKHGFEKLVAIKTILPKFASDLRFQQMFLDEARIAARIEHTNVAQILDLGEEHDVLYLVMEWVDGDALSKLQRAVDKKAMMIPPGVVLRIMADTCGGLHVAHELRAADGTQLGVVHRDVSPQNVLVSARGVAKLIDFGIAKARDRVAGDTNTGFLKGKIQYMAPEQALGQAIDRRADVWAIGSILYHLLKGKPPFEGPNQLATLHLLTSGKPPVPLPPSIHPAISAVVRRALTHDPEKRFASAAELQAALENAMVEAKLTTTTADVAAFTTEHLADRAVARKQAVEIAMQAAQERARMALLLKPTSAESSSGYSSRSGSSPGLSAPGLSPHGMPSSIARPPAPAQATPNAREGQLTAPAMPSPRASQTNLDDAMRRAPLSETSSATLGSAAIESPIPPPVERRRRRWALAVGAVVVIGGALGVTAFAMRGPRDFGANAATRPPPPSASAAFTVASAAPPPSAANAAPSAVSSAAPAPSSTTSASAALTASTTPPAPWGRPSFGGPAGTATQATQPFPLPPTTAKPVAPPPKKKAVDDGF